MCSIYHTKETKNSQELKTFDTNVVLTVGISSIVSSIALVPRGEADSQRVGLTIRVRRIEFFIEDKYGPGFFVSATGNNAGLSLTFFHTNDKLIGPTVDTFFSTSTTNSRAIESYNYASQGRFSVIYQRYFQSDTWQLDPLTLSVLSSSNSEKSYHESIDTDFILNFTNDATDPLPESATNNTIHACLISSKSGSDIVTLRTRIYYTDE